MLMICRCIEEFRLWRADKMDSRQEMDEERQDHA